MTKSTSLFERTVTCSAVDFAIISLFSSSALRASRHSHWLVPFICAVSSTTAYQSQPDLFPNYQHLAAKHMMEKFHLELLFSSVTIAVHYILFITISKIKEVKYLNQMQMFVFSSFKYSDVLKTHILQIRHSNAWSITCLHKCYVFPTLTLGISQ